MFLLTNIPPFLIDPVTRFFALLQLGLGTLFLFAVLYGIYFLLTLPLRRSERARLFLDVLELGLKEGRTSEESIIRAASSRDSALGARFHLVAALLEQGQTLGQALNAVPRVLPPAVVSMLSAGEKTGDIALVLPACRKLLVDSISQVRGALNYLLLLTFAVTPAVLIAPLILRNNLLPVVLSLSEGNPLPAFTRLVFGVNSLFFIGLILAFLFLWGLAFAYIGGPRLRSWLSRIAPGAVDRFLYAFPWRRKRLLRNFTSILSLLLDSGMPEAQAVRLAGHAADNLVVKQRAEKVHERLASGIVLAEAITAIDPSGELRWRVRNAVHRGKDFLRSLEGWHELLDARAFQQEQTAAQLLTTFLVFFNGVIIGAVALSVFLVLIEILNAATLW
jgi:type II secretory pathway component PulF